MEKAIAVLDANKEQCLNLCTSLERYNYQVICTHDLPNLETCLQKFKCPVVIFDLDTLLIDDRVIKQLVVQQPGIHILTLSRHRFHPELRDAITHHIYACINKPVDWEELLYWLKSIYE